MDNKVFDSKSRVMKSLNFEKADRIGIYDEFWSDYEVIVKMELGLAEDISLEDYFDIDIHIAYPDEGIKPTGIEVLSEDKTHITERSTWGSIWRRKKSGYFFEFMEPAASETDDFFKISFDSPSLDSRYENWVNEVKREKEKGKCVFGKIGGPYLRTALVRGEENFLMDIAADPYRAKEMAEKMADHLLAVGIEEIKRGNLYDTGIWIFDDVGCNRGPIMSPKSFEYIFYPAYKRIINGLKKSGLAKVGLHSDGNIMPLLEMLVDAGIDILNPLEPRAGMSIPALLKKYGRKLAYVGGMCNSIILPFATHKDIINKTREILECAQDGGVVIGTHSIGPDIPLENYLTYHRTVMEEGCFQVADI